MGMFGGLFDFMDMADDYEERKVARFEKSFGGKGKNQIIVDTCSVTDSDLPYETGISDARYNNGKWIIVEMYSTKKEAKIGHRKWVELITSKCPPAKLQDVSTTASSKLIDVVKGTKDWRVKPKKRK